MVQVVSLEEAISKIQNGTILMVGGFIGCGAPEQLLKEVCRKGTKD